MFSVIPTMVNVVFETLLLAVEEIPLDLGNHPYDGSHTNFTSLTPTFISTSFQRGQYSQGQTHEGWL